MRAITVRFSYGLHNPSLMGETGYVTFQVTPTHLPDIGWALNALLPEWAMKTLMTGPHIFIWWNACMRTIAEGNTPIEFTLTDVQRTVWMHACVI